MLKEIIKPLTFENMLALEAGLQPKKGETIVTVLPCVDILLALLSTGVKVIGVDVEQRIAHAITVMDNIASGNYYNTLYPLGETLDIQPDINRLYQERIKYFQPRMDAIKANLHNADFIEQYITKTPLSFPFGKLYLSTYLCTNPPDSDAEPINCYGTAEYDLKTATATLRKGGKIYISDSHKLSLLTLPLAPKGFSVDSISTKKATKLESQVFFDGRIAHFQPIVLQKG